MKTGMSQPKIIQQSIISCPNCGYKKEETMPTDACQYFYKCEKCNKVPAEIRIVGATNGLNPLCLST